MFFFNLSHSSRNTHRSLGRRQNTGISCNTPGTVAQITKILDGKSIMHEGY
jgi:hypothetical protein